jgi:hypothetical protein
LEHLKQTLSMQRMENQGRATATSGFGKGISHSRPQIQPAEAM